jgi:hypothetical protein
MHTGVEQVVTSTALLTEITQMGETKEEVYSFYLETQGKVVKTRSGCSCPQVLENRKRIGTGI